MYESEPEPELGGQIIYQPAGKLLGGTSSINGMVYMRGHPADYDGWHQLGCAGWNWESVLPYFRRAEDQERGADEFHGADGPLCVSEPRMRWELADRWTIAQSRRAYPLTMILTVLGRRERAISRTRLGMAGAGVPRTLI
jgi:choline dehydrogenase